MEKNDSKKHLPLGDKDFRPIIRNYVTTNGLFKPSVFYSRHTHTWWEVVFYTHGQGVLTMPTRDIPFKQGTVVCIPPNTSHGERSEEGFENRWVAIEKLETTEPIPVFQVPLQHPVYQLLPILHVESRLEHPMTEVVVRNLFNTFMAYLHEWLATNYHLQLVIQLKRKIIGGIQNPEFKVTDAMDDIPMSRDHLRRIFKNIVGLSPKTYLTEQRMEHAKELLQMGLSIKQTADAVGLPDPYHFSRVFSQTQQLSPSAYKKKNIKSATVRAT